MITNEQRDILAKNLNLKIADDIFLKFQKYFGLFLKYNAHTNLISKNDAQLLFEKHIFDSLSLNLFFKNVTVKNMLDIGAGGGFPSVPVAIAYPQIKVVALDSIKKKMNFVQEIKDELKLDNLSIMCQRAENADVKHLSSFDLVTCRAVSELKNLFSYVVPYIKKGGYFVAFKSKNFQEELDNAEMIIKKSKVKLIKIIDYALPLTENFERKLLVFQKL